MHALNLDLRRFAGHRYAALCASWVRRRLQTGAAPRDFTRVVIVAALGRHNGIVSGAIRQHAAMRSLGIDAVLVDATPALHNPFYRAPHAPGTAYVFHSGGPQTASLIGAVLPAAATAYRVGYWAWELPDPPHGWAGYADDIDEIWTPSSFSQASLARGFDRPIHVAPHAIPAESFQAPINRPPFTVLAMADTRSSLFRKNPMGALQAFDTAFGASADCRLLLKLGGDETTIAAFRKAAAASMARGTVELLTGHLDDAGLAALFRQADVFLSLHRAEGYGLPIREAMARGIPVVATGWSGNMDYMSEANSCPVPFTLVPVNDPSGIYGGSTWAEPDVASAAGLLRRLAADPAERRRIGLAAHRAVATMQPVLPIAPAPSS